MKRWQAKAIQQLLNIKLNRQTKSFRLEFHFGKDILPIDLEAFFRDSPAQLQIMLGTIQIRISADIEKIYRLMACKTEAEWNRKNVIK